MNQCPIKRPEMTLAEQIINKARDLGFDLVGITDAEPLHKDYLNNLLGWLDAGYAGQMTWMHKDIEKRINPAKLLPEAKSIIIVGLNYKPRIENPLSVIRPLSSGSITAYARYDDYHPFIKSQLRKLVDFLIEQTGPCLKFKICVYSTPLLERAFAVKAGLGFIGKNHALIHPEFGPQIFLGELITNLDIGKRETNDERRETQTNGCQKCNQCVSACPTGALRADGSFNATKCISYLTIESNTDIPSDLAPKIANRLFGCAECLLACPYQHKAPACVNKDFVFHPDRSCLDLNEIINLAEDQFKSRFINSPILRPGLPHLQQTARICLNNRSNS
jgi:epoxyqueuosine reductase